MFELPEFVTFARQMNDALKGKTILKGRLGNSPHKFVWYNRSHEEFEHLTAGKTLGGASAKGKWLFLPLEPGYLLLLGECGGKLLYHPPGSKTPSKYHLLLRFEDGSALSALTRMWGAMELYQHGQEAERQYIKGMRPTPIEPEFTFDYFCALMDELLEGKKRSAKSLLTQDQLIPGLGNAIAQDILFEARIHPKYPLSEMSDEYKRALYEAIVSVVGEAIRKGGRYDEYDLYNRPGGYLRLMDKESLSRPCPACGGTIEKIHYLGGACYLCPACQPYP
jgi:formamidopyrimidine-DNA glycosylase